jgi:N-acetylglucosamine-6-phosphate deacetylase
VCSSDLVRFLGIGIAEAVLISSANSARLLGLHRRKGAVRAGLDADLVVLSELLAVEATMIAGRWVAGTP